MAYQRILTIQDISCVGQCSLTVALPILSACGLETAILPSAVLSTHTAGFSGYTFRDLTDDIPNIAAHWKKEGILFNAFYTGYLGSTQQIEYVKQIMNTLGEKNSIKKMCIRDSDQAQQDPAQHRAGNRADAAENGGGKGLNAGHRAGGWADVNIGGAKKDTGNRRQRGTDGKGDGNRFINTDSHQLRGFLIFRNRAHRLPHTGFIDKEGQRDHNQRRYHQGRQGNAID